MKETIEKLKEVIEDGKRLRAKYPEYSSCRILKYIEEIENELNEYLINGVIK